MLARISRSNAVTVLRVVFFLVVGVLLSAAVQGPMSEPGDTLPMIFLITVHVVVDAMVVYFTAGDRKATLRAAGADILCWGVLFATAYVTSNFIPFGYETWKFLLKWAFAVLIATVGAVTFPPVQAAVIVLVTSLTTGPEFGSGMFLGERLLPLSLTLSIFVPFLIWLAAIVPFVLAVRAVARAAAGERVATLRAKAVPLAVSLLAIVVLAPVYQWSISSTRVVKAGTKVTIAEGVTARVPDGFRGDVTVEPPLIALLHIDTSDMGMPGLSVGNGDPYGPLTPETSTGRVDVIQRKYFDKALENRAIDHYGDQKWTHGEFEVPGVGRADVFAIAPVKDTYPTGEVAVFLPTEPTPVIISVDTPELAEALNAGTPVSELGKRALEFMDVSVQ